MSLCIVYAYSTGIPNRVMVNLVSEMTSWSTHDGDQVTGRSKNRRNSVLEFASGRDKGVNVPFVLALENYSNDVR